MKNDFFGILHFLFSRRGALMMPSQHIFGNARSNAFVSYLREEAELQGVELPEKLNNEILGSKLAYRALLRQLLDALRAKQLDLIGGLTLIAIAKYHAAQLNYERFETGMSEIVGCCGGPAACRNAIFALRACNTAIMDTRCFNASLDEYFLDSVRALTLMSYLVPQH
jgi:hypothetical protein